MWYNKFMDKRLEEFLKKINKENPNRPILFLYKAGSHFFNLNTPESDIDIKGIYLPSYLDYKRNNLKQVISYNSNKFTKNSKEDIDITMFSLVHFLELLKNGDFNCMETLYTPDDKIIMKTPLFQEIIDIRENIMVSNIKSFLGFFKKEYRQHSVNADFYKTREDMLFFLMSLDKNKGHKLIDHKQFITEYIKNNTNISTKNVPVAIGGMEQEVIEFALLQFPLNAKIEYIVENLKQKQKNASYRLKDGSTKGLSHCLRLLYQAEDLLSESKEFKFPFDEKRLNMLKKIKSGTIAKELIKKEIDETLNRVKQLDFEKQDNSKQVSNIIDNILFRLNGIMRIASVIG